MDTIELLIVIYLIGMFISAWRYISYVYGVRTSREISEITNKDILFTGLALLCISLLSWFGFLGGIIMFLIDEDDGVFFII